MELTLRQKVILLELARGMVEFDCMQLRFAIKKESGDNLDHHPIDYYLDQLKTKGLLTIARWGEFHKYRFAGDPQPLINLLRANPNY